MTLVVIPTTILLTMFAANLMGYTINRVSLFALIFSIGILVDDAIVVVENIARHWGMRDGRHALQAAVEAVAEVGNPTIVATLTVVAALLPMLFVSGLMGPYMAPIPANASAAMLFSFFVAMVVAPWLMLQAGAGSDGAAARRMPRTTKARSAALYRSFATPGSLAASAGLDLPARRRRRDARCRWRCSPPRAVTVKLLPFDNKSEIAVVRRSARRREPGGHRAHAVRRRRCIARGLPEITSMQAYAGTPAPFNFNGLVRHYYLRERPELGELQVNLRRAASAAAPATPSRSICGERLKAVALPAGAPASRSSRCRPARRCWRRCWPRSTGPTPQPAARSTGELKKIFAAVPFIVDIDDSIGQPRPRLRCRSTRTGSNSSASSSATSTTRMQALFGGVSVGYSHRGEGRNPIEIAVRLPKRDLAWSEALASTPVPANTLPGSKTVVELGDVVRVDHGSRAHP